MERLGERREKKEGYLVSCTTECIQLKCLFRIHPNPSLGTAELTYILSSIFQSTPMCSSVLRLWDDVTHVSSISLVTSSIDGTGSACLTYIFWIHHV